MNSGLDDEGIRSIHTSAQLTAHLGTSPGQSFHNDRPFIVVLGQVSVTAADHVSFFARIARGSLSSYRSTCQDHRNDADPHAVRTEPVFPFDPLKQQAAAKNYQPGLEAQPPTTSTGTSSTFHCA